MAIYKDETETLLESLGGVEPTAPVAEAEESNLQSIGASATEVQELAKNDLDFLAALLMPTVFLYFFPPVLKTVWEWLLSYVNQTRAFPQLALGLPRGFAKTTLMKIFIIFCILFTKKKFILIVGSNQTKAENILADVIDMLEEPNVRAVFGDWNLGIEKDTVKQKKFGFRGRTIVLAAIGAEGDVRGLNLKNERPDIMLMDDIQSKECSESEIQSTSLENWMVSTLLKAKSPSGCMFLFVGNMYPSKHSILRKLKNNPTWIKFIAGGILADGTSLWEDLQPIKQLMQEFQNDLAMGHPEAFYAEVLNDETASSNNLINLNKLPECTYQEGDIPAGNFIIIDPANDKANSDDVSIGYFEVHDALPVMMQLTAGKLSPGDTIRTALRYALTHNCALIAVESNAYQYSLLYWFNIVCQQLNIRGIECVPIYSGSRSKNARILTMLKSYIAGEIFIHERCKLQAHAQMIEFKPMRRDNTDGILDLLTYAPRVIAEFGQYVVSMNLMHQQELGELEVLEHNSPF